MKKVLLTLAVASAALGAAAQDVFRVGTKTVTRPEFNYVYGKNKDVGANIDPKTEAEYLQLYVQFKRKVAFAESLGRDTMPSFEAEYDGYYKQLLKPYLTDKSVDARLVDEAYERMQFDVRASHIMVDCAEDASPSDTAKAYKQILAIKERLNRGETFENLAALSTDTYSASRGGDLGWFTVFGMVYPFETAVYSAPEGQVVGPIRTQFGYHLIKKTAQRAARNTMTAAHILVLDTESDPNPNAEKEIRDVYAKLQAGEPFSAAALKYSEDPTTAKQAGRLAPFGINQMLPEFEDAAFGLSDDGTYSQPIKTKLGWHIVQRINRTPLPSRSEAERQLSQKIRRDERSNASERAYLERLKRDYQFAADARNWERLQSALEKGKGVEKAAKATLYTYRTAVHPNGRELRGTDALATLRKPLETKVDRATSAKRLNEWVKGIVLEEAEKLLPIENAEFRYLAQEYREGILVFELTREYVWDKAATDTVGLKAFYEANLANYQWPERVTGSVLSSSNLTALKKAADLGRQNVPISKIDKVINAKDEVVNFTDVEKVVLGSEGKNALQRMMAQFTSKDRVKGPFESGGTHYVLIAAERIPAGPKALNECRGQVIADYQKHLEALWMKELEVKFPLQMLGAN
ncbi:MAG: peptidylprolyl isomerase [Bacteroidota bacterium]